MTPLVLDPADTRSRPVPEERGAFQRPLVQAGIGVAVLAAAIGLFFALSDAAKPRSTEIKIGRVAEEWQEIKDGVPALKSAGPAIAAPAPVQAAMPAAPRPDRIVAPATAPMLPSSVTPADIAFGTAPAVKTVAVPPVSPPAAIAPAIAPAITPPAVSEATASVAPLPEPKLEAPRLTAQPPRRPVPAQAASEPEAKPRKVATVPARPAPAARREASPPVQIGAPPSTRPAEPEDDHVKVLGLEIPTLATTGRKIKQAVESVSDSVRSLPDKF